MSGFPFVDKRVNHCARPNFRRPPCPREQPVGGLEKHVEVLLVVQARATDIARIRQTDSHVVRGDVLAQLPHEQVCQSFGAHLPLVVAVKGPLGSVTERREQWIVVAVGKDRSQR